MSRHGESYGCRCAQEHPRELMGDEGDRLEAATRDDYAPLFAFAMATGMRQSECLLRWSEVDWGARQICRTGKGGKPVTVPITSTKSGKSSGRCAGIIRNSSSPMSRCGRIETWVKGRRYPITLAGLRAHWHRLRKVAGVTDFRFHDVPA